MRRYDAVYQSVIRELDEQKELLSKKNIELNELNQKVQHQADEGVGQSRCTDDNKDTEREYRDCSAHVFIPWVGNLAYQRRLPEQWELARGGE